MIALELEVAGEMLMLLPQKAIYWPRTSTLIIADIHFGKAGAFRRLGVPVPHGTTAQNLQLLNELIAAYPCKQLIFLGDLLHAAGTSASTMQSLLEWRESHSTLAMTLVRGNHDLRAGDPPDSLSIDIVDEPHLLKPFAFCHYPDIKSDGYVLRAMSIPLFACLAVTRLCACPVFYLALTGLFSPHLGLSLAATPSSQIRMNRCLLLQVIV